MEKEKISALKSGDKTKSEIIEARIRDFKAGKIEIEQILSDPYFGDKILIPETVIQALGEMREMTTASGAVEDTGEIDSTINAFRAGDINLEKLYTIYSVLKEKLSLKQRSPGVDSFISEETYSQGSMPGQGSPQGSGEYSQQTGQPSGMSSPGGDMSKGGSMMQQGMQGSSNMQKGSMAQGQQGMQGGPMMQGQQGNSMMQGGQQGSPQGNGEYSQQTGQPSGMNSPGGDMSKGGSMMQQGMQGSSQETDGYPSAPEESSYEGNIPEDAPKK